MNLGLSLQGAAEFRSPGSFVQAKGKDKSLEENSKPDSFAQVMSGKAQRPSKETKPVVTKSENKPATKRADPDEKKPSELESQSEKTEVTNAPVVAKKSRGPREEAMLKFMDSMESEFSVPPEKIVAAMANLPQDQMLQKPEETAEQVIDQLDLPPEQVEQALALYAGFLNQMAQLPKQQPQAAPDAAAKSEFLQTVPNTNMLKNSEDSKERRAMLSNSLDRMNQKFFMSDRPQFASDRMVQAMDQQAMPAEQVVEKLSYDRALGQAAGQSPVSASAMEKLKQINAKIPDGEQSDAALKELLSKLSAVGAAAEALRNPAVKQAVNQNPAEDQLSADAAASFNQNGLVAAPVTANQFSGSQFFSNSSDEQDDSDSQNLKKSDALEGLGINRDLRHAEKPTEFRDLISAAPIAGGQNRPMGIEDNVKKLINQAQIVLQKGGGEATIRMTPEGLGDVQLKVVVKDGKVNVEMATETKEAKKMIESSLADLKLGLGQHKLAVESIKVDTGLSSSNEQNNSQNRNPDFKQDPGRDQAKQFFQQFREENAGRRDPFIEMPAVKAYGRSSRQPNDVSETSSAVRAQRASAQGRGERMNLVA